MLLFYKVHPLEIEMRHHLCIKPILQTINVYHLMYRADPLSYDMHHLMYETNPFI